MRRTRSGAQGAAIALGIAALLLWAGRSRASVNPRPVIEVYDPETGTLEASSEYDAYDPARGRAEPAPEPWTPITMPEPTAAYSADDLMSAFLAMIRRAEVGGWDDARRYSTFYAGAQFRDLSDHPVATKEMRGVRLSDTMCRAAGFAPGCVSDRSGRLPVHPAHLAATARTGRRWARIAPPARLQSLEPGRGRAAPGAPDRGRCTATTRAPDRGHPAKPEASGPACPGRARVSHNARWIPWWDGSPRPWNKSQGDAWTGTSL